jgi:hypothetical protein
LFVNCFALFLFVRFSVNNIRKRVEKITGKIYINNKNILINQQIANKQIKIEKKKEEIDY